MKKRTAFFGAILSLIPIGQPLLLKTSSILSTTSLVLFVSKDAYASDYKYYFNRGYDKGESGNYYGAIADFTKAIEIKPNGAKAYYNRGWNKGKLNDFYGAIADYTKAIKLDSKYIDAYLNRSILKESLGDIRGACIDAKKVVSLGDQDSDNERWIRQNC